MQINLTEKQVKEIIKQNPHLVAELTAPKEEDFFTVTFPDKTAKEMVNECENKLGKGKLLYDATWYEKEDFYTKEKCRVGTFKISKDLIGLGKNWNECKKLVEEKGGTMLNFAETIYLYNEYFNKTGKYLDSTKWQRTCSRSSLGFLVSLGFGGVDGVYVSRVRPDYCYGGLGVRSTAVETL